MCADQPAVREQANIAGASSGGTPATSSTTADQNSTFVSSGRSGDFFRSASSAAGLELVGDLVARRAELLRRLLQQACARILGAVDAVAEAHQPLAALDQPLDVRLGIARLGGRVEHRQHPRGRAAVERAGERADRRRERGGAVGAGRGGDPGDERRGVEPVLAGADPVRVERLHVLRVGLAPPLEEEALGGRLTLGDRLRRDPVVVPIGDSRRLGGDRDELGREAAQILARLVVRDVDQLLDAPLGAEPRGHGLEVGRRVPRQAAALVGLGGGQPRREALVDEQAPDLLEAVVADELLDVDAAVAERAALAVGLGDLGLERDDAFESGLEVAHRLSLSSARGRDSPGAARRRTRRSAG